MSSLKTKVAPVQSLNISTHGLPSDAIYFVENINEGLKAGRDADNDIILEGIAAKFGVKNNNNRIYEKAEYLPHLEYLNEKIKGNNLYGEMDHPQNFDVSLKNVSHIIEALYYDPQSDDVRIKVRLLDTPLGRIAKTLVESGCTLSISSRAAGQVLNEGRVKLHRIFTYDLVAEPGFSQARLNRTINESLQEFNVINESFNFRKQASFVEYDDITESYNFGADTKIYKLKENTSSVENNSRTMSEFITKSEFNKYSTTIKKRYDALSESVESLKIDEKDATIGQLVAYTNYLAEELKGMVKYTNYLAETLDQSIQYSQHISENVNNVADYANYVGEKTSQAIHFGNYVAGKLNETANYTEYLGGKLNEQINYANYLAETLNRGIEFTDYVGEQVNNVIEFTDYLGEKVTHGIAYTGYLAENLDKNMMYTEYIVEGLNEGMAAGIPTSSPTTKLNESINAINESLDINVSESSSIEDIANAVATIARKVESNTADAVLESAYPFLKIMSKNGKENFKSLDTQTKTDVVKALGSLVWTNESEVNNIIQAIINKKNQNVPAYIAYMPVEYKELYEAMTDREKSTLAAQAYGFQLVSPYQVKNFWQTRNLTGIQERIELNRNQETTQHLNESQSKEGYVSLAKVADMTRGYSQDYVNRFIKK